MTNSPTGRPLQRLARGLPYGFHVRELGFLAYGYGFDLDEQPTTHLIFEQIRAKRAVQISFETESLLYLSSGLPLSMGLSAIAAALSQRRLWPLALRDAHAAADWRRKCVER